MYTVQYPGSSWYTGTWKIFNLSQEILFFKSTEPSLSFYLAPNKAIEKIYSALRFQVLLCLGVCEVQERDIVQQAEETLDVSDIWI